MALISFDRRQSLGPILETIHQRMYAKYSLQQQATQDIQTARQLEVYLRTLKHAAARTPQNALVDKLDDQWMQLAKATANQLIGTKGASGKVSVLFKRKHAYAKNTGYDDIFEAEFNAMLKALNKVAVRDSSQSIKLANSISGMSTANINLQQAMNTEVRQVLTAWKNKLTIAQVKKLPENELYTMPKATRGKIDMEGLSVDIDIEAAIKPEWQDFYKLLQGATFTAKNYASLKWDNVSQSNIESVYKDLTLGNTDPYKAIYGALSTLGYNQTEIDEIFIRGWNILNGRKRERAITQQHFYHLKFIYELTGAGLLYGGKIAKEAKFLVFNDPSTENIYVKSTAELIIQLLNSKIMGDPLKGIHLPKAALINKT